MTQWQLDHLAQRVDGVAHPAEVVISDVRAAFAIFLLEFRKQFDLRVRANVDDAFGGRADDRQANFLQGEGRSVQHLPDFFRHIGIDALVTGRGDHIAFRQRPVGKTALQCSRRPLEADVVLRRGKDDARGGLRLRLADLHEITRASASVRPLQAIEPNDVEPGILRIRPKRTCSGRTLADDLDDVAFAQSQALHRIRRQSGEPPAPFHRGQVGDLQFGRRRPLEGVRFCHALSFSAFVPHA